jgi:hypothetical protein
MLGIKSSLHLISRGRGSSGGRESHHPTLQVREGGGAGDQESTTPHFERERGVVVVNNPTISCFEQGRRCWGSRVHHISFQEKERSSGGQEGVLGVKNPPHPILKGGGEQWWSGIPLSYISSKGCIKNPAILHLSKGAAVKNHTVLNSR